MSFLLMLVCCIYLVDQYIQFTTSGFSRDTPLHYYKILVYNYFTYKPVSKIQFSLTKNPLSVFNSLECLLYSLWLSSWLILYLSFCLLVLAYIALNKISAETSCQRTHDVSL